MLFLLLLLLDSNLLVLNCLSLRNGLLFMIGLLQSLSFLIICRYVNDIFHPVIEVSACVLLIFLFIRLHAFVNGFTALLNLFFLATFFPVTFLILLIRHHIVPVIFYLFPFLRCFIYHHHILNWVLFLNLFFSFWFLLIRLHLLLFPFSYAFFSPRLEVYGQGEFTVIVHFESLHRVVVKFEPFQVDHHCVRKLLEVRPSLGIHFTVMILTEVLVVTFQEVWLDVQVQSLSQILLILNV